MNPIVFALRRPYTVVVGVVALVLAAGLARLRMPVDIFPDLNTPVIYVAQPYGGLSPQQMEGHLTNYFEYHFLYITGIEHVESRNIQGMALMKLYFQPGTNMAQAMAEVVSYVNRSRSFMPPNTVPPFVMRFDAGSVPVGYLVFSSETKTIGQIQDEAIFRVRPMFASLPGVSAPPPFGGNQKTIIIRANPERLRSLGMSPDEIVTGLAKGNAITPAGSLEIGGQAPMVPVNSTVEDFRELEKIPLRQGPDGAVYVRDVARVVEGQDVATGYGLVNGRRSVYILVTKRADASTLAVVNEVRQSLPRLQQALSDDIRVSFEFDQSPYVTRAMTGVAAEAAIGGADWADGAPFLRDWRSVVVVVLNIHWLLGRRRPVAVRADDQPDDARRAGGRRSASSSTRLPSRSRISTRRWRTPGRSLAPVRLGNQQTAVPRLLAMLYPGGVHPVVLHAGGGTGGCSFRWQLAVGFAMVTSYLLSSTLVPVLSVWLLRHVGQETSEAPFQDNAGRLRRLPRRPAAARSLPGGDRPPPPAGGRSAIQDWGGDLPGGRRRAVPARQDAGRHHARRQRALARDVLAEVARQAGGDDRVDISVSLVGTASYNYPINSIYLDVRAAGVGAADRPARDSGIRIEEFKERLGMSCRSWAGAGRRCVTCGCRSRRATSSAT
ncbi:MAG: efflux RND transporter permease subunit [Gemmataceae bacterium]